MPAIVGDPYGIGHPVSEAVDAKPLKVGLDQL